MLSLVPCLVVSVSRRVVVCGTVRKSCEGDNRDVKYHQQAMHLKENKNEQGQLFKNAIARVCMCGFREVFLYS